MPGIPMIGSSEASAFWISFWAALYSGALYSIITGLVVGLAVLWVQRISDGHKTINEYKKGLAIFLEHLRVAVEQPDDLNISSIKKSVPSPVLAVTELLKRYPIDVWSDGLRKDRNFLSGIKKLRRADQDFLVITNELDSKLTSFIRKLNSDKGLMPSNDATDIAFFIGRINNIQDEDIIPWLSPITSNALPRLESSCSAALGNREIDDLVKRYIEQRARLQSLIQAIKISLNERLGNVT